MIHPFLFGSYNAARVVAAPAYDADAEAGFTAAGITDTPTKDRVNTLIVGLKNAGVWAKLTSLYLTKHGSATANAVNWKNPGTYNLVFYNAPTHGAYSVQWNGTNQYADTGVVPETLFAAGNAHLAYYSTTDSSELSAWDMGALEAGRSRRFALRHRQSSVGVSVLFLSNATGIDNNNYNMPSTSGFTVGNIAADVITMHKNGVALTAVGNSSSGGGFPAVSVWLGGQNKDGVIDGPSTKACAMASLGHALTATEAVNYSALAKAFIQAGLYAAKFDGVNDYIQLAMARPSHLAGTIECWIKPTTYDGTFRYILGVGATNDTVKLFGFRLNDNGVLAIGMRTVSGTGTDLTGYKTTTAVPANEWSHVALTGDGSSWKVYLNGVLQSLVLDYGGSALLGKWIGYLPSDTYTTTISSYKGSSQFMAGSIHSLRIWDRVLSQAEIETAMNTAYQGAETNLFANYKLDEGALDSAGGGYHGTEYNGVDYQPK